uniref:Uncharacterized protein n=1 Tax=Glossina pallidipes TaxID=7398 RepID=A0A1A9ZZF9_GLOPL
MPTEVDQIVCDVTATCNASIYLIFEVNLTNRNLCTNLKHTITYVRLYLSWRFKSINSGHEKQVFTICSKMHMWLVLHVIHVDVALLIIYTELYLTNCHWICNN